MVEVLDVCRARRYVDKFSKMWYLPTHYSTTNVPENPNTQILSDT